ncbi:phosphopantetheine-binding protein [Streptomyces sp. NPDC047022]|uniref:phosphopantetheine-binding protein n=1 Tax=Streptomyces sp. NPDC047022 TaxID=3155737 RepID=UPI00340B4260
MGAYEKVRAGLGVKDAAEVVGAPGTDGSGPDEDRTTPDSSFERILTKLWAEALACPRVDAQADLFDLGLESRIALAVSARLSEVFRIPVPVRVMFDRPVISEQASWPAEQDASAAHSLAAIAQLSGSS